MVVRGEKVKNNCRIFRRERAPVPRSSFTLGTGDVTKGEGGLQGPWIQSKETGRTSKS